jgi:hypothetical protein
MRPVLCVLVGLVSATTVAACSPSAPKDSAAATMRIAEPTPPQDAPAASPTAAQQRPAAGGQNPDARPTSTLTFVGEVVETTAPGPLCGILAVAQRARYRVRKVLAGGYSLPLIDVTLPCETTTVGTVERVVVGPTPEADFSWTIIGALSKPSQPSFWSRRRRPIQP